MYEGYHVELKRLDDVDSYEYRVTDAKGNAIQMRKACNGAMAKMLPMVFNGADMNFHVEGDIIVFDGLTNEAIGGADDLTYDANAERVTLTENIGTFLRDGEAEPEVAANGRNLNVTQLEKERDSEDDEIVEAQHKVYKKTLMERKLELQRLNEQADAENAESYSICGDDDIRIEIEETGYYYDKQLGCRSLVRGYSTELDYFGLMSVRDLPIPLPEQVERYEAAVKAGVPEDQLPLSPDEIIGLCTVVRPMALSSITDTKLVKGPDGLVYKAVPIYGERDKVSISSTVLLPQDYTVYDKWNAVMRIIEKLDALCASMLNASNLTIQFTRRPKTTMAVAPNYLIVGIAFLLEHSVQECAFVLLHESRHLLFEHATRRGLREPGLWNLATDLIINKQLMDSYDVDPADPAGGRIVLRLKDANKVERDVVVSDGRYAVKMVPGGLYSSKIDIATDTAERVYVCLEMGVDTFDAAMELKKQKKKKNAVQNQNTVDLGTVRQTLQDVMGQQLQQSSGGGDDGDGDEAGDGVGNGFDLNPEDLTDEMKAMLRNSAKHDMNMGTSGGGAGSSMSVNMEIDTTAYLYKVVLAYAGMLRNGIDCKGVKISKKVADATRKILDPYMRLFGLRY